MTDPDRGRLLIFFGVLSALAALLVFASWLANEAVNHNEIKWNNWGKEQPSGDVESLELGPNNCAAN